MLLIVDVASEDDADCAEDVGAENVSLAETFPDDGVGIGGESDIYESMA